MPNDFSLLFQGDIHTLAGLLGFSTYVALYTALSLRFLHSDSIYYFAGNICAASLVLFSLTADWNLAAALIQMFWIAMGVPAIVIRVMRIRSNRRAAAAAQGQKAWVA